PQVLSFHQHGGKERLELVAERKGAEVAGAGLKPRQIRGSQVCPGEVGLAGKEPVDDVLVLLRPPRTSGVENPSARLQHLRDAREHLELRGSQGCERLLAAPPADVRVAAK